MHTVVSAFIDGSTKYLMLPTDWLCYGKFMKVNISITIKRDILGLPLVLFHQ